MKKLFKFSILALFVGSMLIFTTACKKKGTNPTPTIDRTVTFEAPYNWKVISLYTNDDGSVNKLMKKTDKVMFLCYLKDQFNNYTQLPLVNDDGFKMTYDQEDNGILTLYVKNNVPYEYPYNQSRSFEFRFLLMDIYKAKVLIDSGQDLKSLSYDEAIRLIE